MDGWDGLGLGLGSLCGAIIRASLRDAKKVTIFSPKMVTFQSLMSVKILVKEKVIF